MIHGIVFHLIHILIDFFIILKNTYRCLWTVYCRVFVSPVDFSVVASEYSSCEFSKVPFHLGVIIGEDLISFSDESISDVSNLILWCLCIGIRHISIYDLNGFLKENGGNLYECTARKTKLFFKESTATYKITFNCNLKQFVLCTQAINGHKVESIYVDLLSSEDGRKKIVQAARTACLNGSHVLSSNFHALEFDRLVKGYLKVPDPDLIICFGPVSSLMGYLPWHVRLSEILSLPSHYRVQFTEFFNVLKKYDRCEQRFGK